MRRKRPRSATCDFRPSITRATPCRREGYRLLHQFGFGLANVHDNEALFELLVERALFRTWINPRQPDSNRSTRSGPRTPADAVHGDRAPQRNSPTCARERPPTAAGIDYVDSWVDLHYARCFQLMRTDDHATIDRRIAAWSDLAVFEVVPVWPSA
jgi:hypothetical protein